LQQARYAIAAGVDVLQIRERDLSARALSSLVSDIVALAKGTSTRVIVNDRVDVALGCGAGGVHLRGDSVSPADVRSIAPSGFLIGRSVHTRAEAAAVPPAADYLIAGTVFESASKPASHPRLGVDDLRAIVQAADLPVLAIGGVTLERLATVAGTGAAGAAAIGLFCGPGPGDPATGCRAAELTDLVKTARMMFDEEM
jgi:thiamine-phosphate diphosphorylase